MKQYLKDYVIEKALEDHHPNELYALTGWTDKECKQIVHMLYMKNLNKNGWYPKFEKDEWVIYHGNGQEWIDDSGEYATFELKEHAEKYLKLFFRPKLSPIDQAFFDLYSGSISECSDEILLRFLKDHDSVDSMEGYSHLMDTHIAFNAGIEYGRKNP
jgi:hypothetical protein